jgi:hypothetical protein
MFQNEAAIRLSSGSDTWSDGLFRLWVYLDFILNHSRADLNRIHATPCGQR